METPDFEQIGKELRKYFTDDGEAREARQNEMLDQVLRQVWNARGAADAVKLEAELSGMMGVTMAGPYVKNLDRAIRTLDR